MSPHADYPLQIPGSAFFWGVLPEAHNTLPAESLCRAPQSWGCRAPRQKLGKRRTRRTTMRCRNMEKRNTEEAGEESTNENGIGIK